MQLGTRGALAVVTTIALGAVLAPASSTATAPVASTAGHSALASRDRAQPPRITTGLNRRIPESDPGRAALRLLASDSAKFKIADPYRQLRVARVDRLGDQIVVRLDQRVGGLPVFGAQYAVRMHPAAGGMVVDGTSGRLFPDLVAGSAAPTVGQARVVALRSHGTLGYRQTQVRDLGLVVLPLHAGLIARHVQLTAADARSGTPVRRELFIARGFSRPVLDYSSLETAAPDRPTVVRARGFHGKVPLRVVRTKAGVVGLRDTTRPMAAGGAIVTRDGWRIDALRLLGGRLPRAANIARTRVPVPKSFNRAGSVDAHWGAGKVYEYYRSLGRDGLDGRGHSIVSVTGAFLFRKPFPNAFWNGHFMVYGAGNHRYKPFSSSLDVVGHEMTHGVIEHSANLVYFGQPGALNEAVADYFGNAIEDNALGINQNSVRGGLLGQDLCRRLGPVKCAVRNLNDRATVASFNPLLLDDGGVHINSTILSGALWDIRQSLGARLGDKIVYDVLTGYLTPLSDFVDLREATIAAATAAGVTASQLAMVTAAFDRRGIVAGWEESTLKMDYETVRWPLAAMYQLGGLGGSSGATNGSYLVSDYAAATKALRIFSGSVGGPDPVAISPDDPRWHLEPATDGTSAAWLVVDPRSGAISWLRSDLSGGNLTTVVANSADFPLELEVGGDIVAGLVVDTRDRMHLVARKGDLPVRNITLPGGSAVMDKLAGISGDEVIYTHLNASTMSSSILAYNVVTQQSRAVLPSSTNLIVGGVVAGDRVFYVAASPTQGSNDNGGIGSVGVDGTGEATLLAAKNPKGPSLLASMVLGFTASPEAVTYPRVAGSRLRLFQLAVGSSAPARMSCSLGDQLEPSSLGGTAVLWTDFSKGIPGLVRRDAPAAVC